MQESLIVYKDDEYLPISNEKRLNNEKLFVQNKIWKDYGMKELCKHIQKWELSQFWIDSNLNKAILKEIREISFPRLSKLFVGNNKILSIEDICRLNAPQLTNLGIGDNNIISIKQLKKCYWKKMQWISLRNNKIGDLFPLTETNLKLIEGISVERMINDTNQSQNMSMMAKLDTEKLKTIWIYNKNRIKQDTVNTIVSKRYTDIEIKQKE